MSLKSVDINGFQPGFMNSWAHLGDESINGNQFLLALDTCIKMKLAL